ncbi:hypothetical protein M405DRAFT_808196 [Rhizopogon salebrosus TDB-379]|nr:hypothetical protein M405DRAFT_808196 [Rhizopogon salebrosus TDB-379]
MTHSPKVLPLMTMSPRPYSTGSAPLQPPLAMQTDFVVGATTWSNLVTAWIICLGSRLAARWVGVYHQLWKHDWTATWIHTSILEWGGVERHMRLAYTSRWRCFRFG